MRELLITIAAVMLTGCIGASKTELLKDEKGKPIILPIESVAEADAKPESSTAKAPKISIHDAAAQGNNDAIKQHLSAGTDINTANPFQAGKPIPENEVVAINGGQVPFTSTDQKGNFRIGDGLTIDQTTSTIRGRDFNRAIQAQLTPLILALR